METRYFKTLLKVIETGSFSRAAEVLYITQSAASQRIKLLEETLGHKLLDRSGSDLVPTDIGKFVALKSQEIVEKEQELLNALKNIAAGKRLSLALLHTGIRHSLPAPSPQQLHSQKCRHRRPEICFLPAGAGGPRFA